MTRARRNGLWRWILPLVLLLLGAPAIAAVYEVRVPLRDGRLSVPELSRRLMEELGGTAVRTDWLRGEVNLRGLGGNLYLSALNHALGEGFALSVEDAVLRVRVDTAHLPRSWRQAKGAARAFVAEAAPQVSGAERRRWGLWLPAKMDADRELTVLVHGLDCGPEGWQALSGLLETAGQQVAYFSYPSDQPLEEDAALLAEHLSALRRLYPRLRVSLIGHSMGALICRAYVEGEAYHGGIDRLIMIAPPNQGSSWAAYRLLTEAHEHWNLFRKDGDWSVTWMITDGLGEAGADLKPGSAFLTQLNRRPRNASVRYTIIAGDRNQITNFAADTLDRGRRAVFPRVSQVWGARWADATVRQWTTDLRQRPAKGDGPVTVEAARLEGVTDFVILHADHGMLHRGGDGQPPAAWPVIRERMGQNSSGVAD